MLASPVRVNHTIRSHRGKAGDASVPFPRPPNPQPYGSSSICNPGITEQGTTRFYPALSVLSCIIYAIISVVFIRFVACDPAPNVRPVCASDKK